MKKRILVLFAVTVIFPVSVFGQDVIQAVKDFDLTRVKELVTGNKNRVNEKDNRNATPLHFAADRGLMEIAELLINNNADLTAKDVDGDTPLHWVAYAGRSSIVSLLAEAGSPVNAVR